MRPPIRRVDDATRSKAVHVALARAIATRDIADQEIEAATEKLRDLPEIRKIDHCIYGICLDFWFGPEDFSEQFERLIHYDKGRLGEIRVFKYGIINPEIFHVQAELDVPEIAAAERFR